VKRVLVALSLLAAACSMQLGEQHFFHPGPPERDDDASKWQLPAESLATYGTFIARIAPRS